MLRRKHIRFLRLYEPVHKRFERFCQVRCYGEMEAGDLINESLLIAYEKMDQLRSKEVFLSFLCGISVRVLANSHRKQRPLTGVSFLENHAQTEISSDLETEKHFLYEALGLLSVEQREAVILFEITGFRIREIAEIQECSEDAVKQRLKRGRERLKEILTFESIHQRGEHYE